MFCLLDPRHRALSATFALLLTACLPADPESGVGSLNLALTSDSGGVTYRLTDARFALQGPEAMAFASSEAPEVSVELSPGSYTLELLSGYRLVRADDPAGTSVTASLLSENPAPLLVEPGVTTEVALRFELSDGTELTNQRGAVKVGLDLNPASDAGLVDACLDGLRIHEVDYDQPSTDDAEFVEVLNTADCAADLSQVVLELVNGSDNQVYTSYPLLEAGPSLAAHAYLVVGDPGVLSMLPNDVVRIALKSVGLQNGPDGVRLVSGTRVIDGFAYEGPLAGTGEGDPVGADEAAQAFGRCPNGIDSNQNALDFQLLAPSPGLPNPCE